MEYRGEPELTLCCTFRSLNLQLAMLFLQCNCPQYSLAQVYNIPISYLGKITLLTYERIARNAFFIHWLSFKTPIEERELSKLDKLDEENEKVQ